MENTLRHTPPHRRTTIVNGDVWQGLPEARRREQCNEPGTGARTPGTPRPLYSSTVHLHPIDNGKSQPAQDEPANDQLELDCTEVDYNICHPNTGSLSGSCHWQRESTIVLYNWKKITALVPKMPRCC